MLNEIVLDREAIADYFRSLQDDICRQLEEADGEGLFQEDIWDREAGGGGRTRVIQGRHIEKGGVAFSAVHGDMPQKIAQGLQLSATTFFATGVSIVLHPSNPHAPIIHMNIRYFETDKGWWFGGGIDLTPHYVSPEDAVFFHKHLKEVCDQSHPEFYSRFKPWADDYFYLKHRKETRGIGGIFFDRLDAESGMNKTQLFEFVSQVGEVFCPIYRHLLQKNKDLPFTDQEKNWQMLRRGRYVEFNLVWDKGTKFGLDTDGRTESILMSLPPTANWLYNFTPQPGSAEATTLNLLRKGVDWTTSPNH
jgi:coproporphyrinogen III oxidase